MERLVEAGAKAKGDLAAAAAAFDEKAAVTAARLDLEAKATEELMEELEATQDRYDAEVAALRCQVAEANRDAAATPTGADAAKKGAATPWQATTPWSKAGRPVDEADALLEQLREAQNATALEKTAVQHLRRSSAAN